MKKRKNKKKHKIFKGKRFDKQTKVAEETVEQSSTAKQTDEQPTFLKQGDSRMMIYMDRSVAKDIEELVREDSSKECGAILIGCILQDRITDHAVAFIKDIYSDHKYGTSSEYTFGKTIVPQAFGYLRKKYGDEYHIIGTIHSHAVHPAFFSTVDDRMMKTQGPNQIHMVVSPSANEFVATFMNDDFEYHNEIQLNMSNIKDVFPYRRKLDHYVKRETQ